MEEESTRVAQWTRMPITMSLEVHGTNVNDGDVNLAARDVTVHKYYYGFDGTEIDITTALRSIPNLRKIHLDVLSKATPGTGIWFLQSDIFVLWLNPNGDLYILWGFGIPGAGKSVLASIVINELEARAEAAGSHICVAYTYIRYNESAQLTVRGVLEVLVKQTVERHADCAALAKRVYSRHLREETVPTEADLLQLLHGFTNLKAATFYIIDAVDEAPRHIQLDLVQKLSSLKARLFITSRPLDFVEAQLPAAHVFSIVAQDVDLELRIAQEIARSPDLQCLLQKADASLGMEIVAKAKQKCSGMFLHASLQLDALSSCVSIHEVQQALEVFPSAIEDVIFKLGAGSAAKPQRTS